MRCPLLLLSAALLLPGCPVVDIESDDRNFDLRRPDLAEGEDPLPTVRSSQFLDLRNDTPMLEGTLLCGRLDSDINLPTEDEEAWRDCYDVQLSRVTAEDRGNHNTCWTLGAGELTWTFDPVACALAEPGDLPEDVLRLTGVPATDVTGAFLPFPEYGAWEHLNDEAGDALPDSVVDPLPSPLLVAAGAVVRLEAGLMTDGTLRPVAWTEEHGRVRFETLEGSAPERLEVDGASPEAGATNAATFTVNLKEGTVIQAFLDIGDQSFDLGEVRAVARSEASEITVDVVFDDNGAFQSPAGARAVVRDGDGNRIFGMPMRWTSAPEQLAFDLGTGPFDRVPHLMGGDYVRLEDTCRRPSDVGGDFTTTVAVEAGDLTGELEIGWSRAEDDSDDADWTRPTTCKAAGCACDSAGGPPASLSWIGLLVVGGLAIRRRRSAAGPPAV